MPRLNGVLMAVLAVAVIGTAVFLSLEKAPAPAGPDPAHVQKLLRKLADGDPDVRREAEAGFRSMGVAAVAPLVEASKSPDRRLAETAASLLKEVEPAKPAVEAARKPDPAPEAAAKVDPVELILVCGRSKARPDDPVRFYVRVVNHGTAPVLVLRHGTSYRRFAWIEILDEKGAVAKVAPEPGPDRTTDLALEAGAVAPGETRDLYAGIGDGATGLASLPGKGVFRVRFVYDASEEGAYRKAAAASEQGTLLPPMRLVSNAVEIAVAD